MQNFTFDYFLSQISEFRELCGNRAFMENEEKQDVAIKALSFVYFNTKCDDENRLAMIFQATIDNYNQRKSFMARLLLKKLIS